MWTQWNEIDRLFRTMNLLDAGLADRFSDVKPFRRPAPVWLTMDRGPRTNFYDNGDTLQMQLEVPGIPRENLTIKVQGNYLEVSGSRAADPQEGYTNHRKERVDGSFTRSFTLPTEVDTEHVEARLKNGILTLVLPKAETAKPKQITVH
ncbi:MAG: Hsp20/alpha crystallin family protein [Desulfofustis sp.]|nr:Hsp20/alpha crystallin family protein [Desulfofustis sp.]